MLYTKKKTNKQLSVPINSKLFFIPATHFKFTDTTCMNKELKILKNRNGKRICSVFILNLLVRYFHSVLPDLQECFQQFQVVAIHRPSVIVHISHHKLHQAAGHGSVLDSVLPGKIIKSRHVSLIEQQIPS